MTGTSDKDWDKLNHNPGGHPSPRPYPTDKKSRRGWVFGAAIAVVLILAVCGVAAAILFAGRGNSSYGDKDTGSPIPSAKPDPRLGEAATDGGLTFTIKAMTCDVDKVEKRVAKGDYCVLDLTVQNTGNGTRTYVAANQKGFIGKARYVSSGNVLTSIGPGRSITTKLVFDVPSDKVLTKVELHESIISRGVVVVP